MPQYRVVDLRSNVIQPRDIFVADAITPEDAVEKALGVAAVRTGHIQDLVARVYWQIGSKPVNMARLYRPQQVQTGEPNGKLGGAHI